MTSNKRVTPKVMVSLQLPPELHERVSLFAERATEGNVSAAMRLLLKLGLDDAGAPEVSP